MNEIIKSDYRDLIVELSRQVESNNLVIQKCNNVIMELKPKADFYDRVTKSKTVFDMKQAAKILNYENMGRNKWFKLLRRAGILMKNNEPHQPYCDAGYFRVILEHFTTSDGRQMTYAKTVVYPKGLDFMRRKINEYLANTAN